MQVRKSIPSILLAIHLYSPDELRDTLYLSNYATLHIKDVLARLPGVGDVQFQGAREYAMRIGSIRAPLLRSAKPARVASDTDDTSGEALSALRETAQVPLRHSICPIGMSKWRCIERLPDELPVWQMTIH